MPIPYPYDEMHDRLERARKVGPELAGPNRCALVVGIALHMRPEPGDQTHRGLKASPAAVRNDPLLDRFFLKAAELALRIACTYGAPDLTLRRGQSLTALEGKQGVIYLDNCWSTPSEKFLNKLPGQKAQSGDHIDLWNGQVLAIYPTESASRSLLTGSETIKFWRAAD